MELFNEGSETIGANGIRAPLFVQLHQLSRSIDEDLVAFVELLVDAALHGAVLDDSRLRHNSDVLGDRDTSTISIDKSDVIVGLNVISASKGNEVWRAGDGLVGIDASNLST